MKRSKTLLLTFGVIIAVTLTVTQSMYPGDTSQFFISKSNELVYQKDNFNHLDIVTYSIDLFTKNLPYLNSK